MRYSLLVALGLLCSWPAEAEASCFGRCWGRCSGCYGGYYAGCYGSCWGSCHGGCWGGRCYGGWSYGYSGCYGGCHGVYGTAWNGYVSSYNTAGYAHGASYQYRPSVPATRVSNYYDARAIPSRMVKLDVVVADPAGTITIEGVTMTTSGTKRSYESPVLESDTPYYYTIAYQSQDGATRESRTIVVHAGELVLVDFTQPAPVATVPVREKLSMPESKPK
jgi:uncharacterized protein (TIGR03000 family)